MTRPTREDYINAKTDEKVFEKVFTAHQKLINYCLKRHYLFDNVPKEEYESVLTASLWQAIITFDPDRGNMFSNYALIMMSKAISRYNQLNCSTFKMKVKNKIFNMGTLLYEEEDVDHRVFISDGSYESEMEQVMGEYVDPYRLLEFLSGREHEYMLEILKGKTQRELGREHNISAAMVSSIVIRGRARLKNVIKNAKIVNLLFSKGYSIERVTHRLKFKSCEVADYYRKVYNYLFLDGPKPRFIDEKMSRVQIKVPVESNNERQ